MKKAGMNATGLRKFLIFVLILTLAGVGSGFYYGLTQIREYAIETNQKVADAEASGTQIDELRQLQTTLSQSDSLIAKADDMFATNSNYQSQAITDLRRYASAAGVSIQSTDFTEPDNAPAALNTRTVSVGLGGSVTYTELIRFLELVEGNLPKMQPISLTISRPDDPTENTVTVSDITINIATR